MTPEAQAAAEADCVRLMMLYARFVDGFDVDGFASLFTDDAELILPATRRSGREAIRRGFARRDPELVSRHVITNPLVEVAEATTAEGRCYLTLYRNQALEDGTLADPLRPSLVGEYRDLYALTPEGWRISRRELIVAFTG